MSSPEEEPSQDPFKRIDDAIAESTEEDMVWIERAILDIELHEIELGKSPDQVAKESAELAAAADSLDVSKEYRTSTDDLYEGLSEDERGRRIRLTEGLLRDEELIDISNGDFMPDDLPQPDIYGPVNDPPLTLPENWEI